MKITWSIALGIVLVVGLLAGCGGDAAPSQDASQSRDTQEFSGAAPVASTEDPSGAVQVPESSESKEGYTSAALDIAYEGALPAGSQLALGTLELEGTESSVTLEQAKTLLPLWQAIQGGSLQSDVETNAVLKQIEGSMAADRLAAIAAMQLTFEDMGAWMQEQGVNLGRPEGAGEGQTPFGNMNEEERAAMRATRQAGGQGGSGPGGFGNLSESERASMRATAEAGGMTFPSGGGPGGGFRAGRGQLALLAEQVVELLIEMAAQ